MSMIRTSGVQVFQWYTTQTLGINEVDVSEVINVGNKITAGRTRGRKQLG